MSTRCVAVVLDTPDDRARHVTAYASLRACQPAPGHTALTNDLRALRMRLAGCLLSCRVPVATPIGPTSLLAAQWRITHSCASRYVRTSKEVSTTGDRKRAGPIACRLIGGRPRRRRSSGEGSARAGRNRSLERSSPPAATRSWEAASGASRIVRPGLRSRFPALKRDLGSGFGCNVCGRPTSDVGLELRTNVWLQLSASVPTLRPGLSRSGRPRASPSHRDCPRSGSWTVLCSATCRQRNAAQCGRSDEHLGTAGAPGRARVVVGLFCEGTLPSGSAAGP